MASQVGGAELRGSGVRTRRVVSRRKGRDAGLHRGARLAPQGRCTGQRSGGYELGKLYLLGSGVPQDYSQAARWFVKAAERDNPQAQNALGYMYGQGQGVVQNY